ncbi:MAG: hypothetical protein LBF83_06980 [Spirochaetaceae bacterium]|jgi:ClpP class serine protease|nr:hypothetical protein [Spirochaetaceae bacterium]
MNEARAAAEGGESREEFISRVMEEDGESPDDAGGEAEYREWLGELYDRANGGLDCFALSTS